jgi:hypothetical protein
MADFVAKVFSGRSAEIHRAADVSYVSRHERPHRFASKRPLVFLLTALSITAAKLSKNRYLRDFWRRWIFDFCNKIGIFQT